MIRYPVLCSELKSRGMTQAKLADSLGVPITTLSSWLIGKAALRLDDAKRIRKAIGTGLPLDRLFYEKGEKWGVG